MSYFVTGGSGFIGRFLLPKLFARKGTIYLLVRKGSVNKLKEQLRDMDAPMDRIELVTGDLTKDNLGISQKQLKSMTSKVKHFLHLAAVYDLAADLGAQLNTNVDGTQHAMDVAEAIKAGCFHHISSIAVAGLYPGVFREDMFDEAEGLEHPYFRTKHDAEKVVRKNCQIPYRIYRPAMVLGHSETGEIDKIDGPYYFFKLIQKLRKVFPQWMPLMGIEGGRLNMVPVDYVVDVVDHIVHKKGLDGGCFHITDPKPMRIGHMLNVFADAANAPQMNMRIDARVFNFIPGAVKQGLMMLSPVKRIRQQIMNDLGIPPGVLNFVNYPTRFDDRETQKAIKGSGIKLPKLKSYAWTLWDYWERHLDPDLFIDRSLSGRVKGKRVMVTGATSGIGLATALMLAEAGAELIIVARSEDKLADTSEVLQQAGASKVHIYSADISNEKSANQLVANVIADLGGVDILINNAGRSIRRSISLSYDRFHDYERTMDLNYFGSLRLIMGFLPGMSERCLGHVINISSIGVLTNAPRFSAYVASKAALDAFARCAAAEYNDVNVAFTTINMPLVRTPMIAPTKIYDSVPTISPEEAALFIKDAIIRRPQRIATRLGVFAQVMHALAPKSMEVMMNTAFNMFPDTSAAKGEKDGGSKDPSPEQMAFTSLMRGVHW